MGCASKPEFVKCMRFILETVCRKSFNCVELLRVNYTTAQI
nr:MAG TPA: hypothetical protein [Caudoviricetes sp.]